MCRFYSRGLCVLFDVECDGIGVCGVKDDEA